MVKSKLFAASIAATLTVGTAALASDDVLPSADSTFKAYGEVEGWNIMVDESRNTCLIERMDANNNVIQMGITADHQFGYLGVFSQIAELKGKKEDLVLLVGDNLYTGESRIATKNLSDGYVGGYALTNNPAFVDDVMNQTEMVVFPEKNYAFIVKLDGTKKAIEAARECNMEVNS